MVKFRQEVMMINPERKEGPERTLQIGDQIVFYPASKTLAVWGEHGRILEFRTSGGTDDKILTGLVSNSGEFTELCVIIARFSGLDIERLPNSGKEGGSDYHWMCRAIALR